jgi:hypothetical protein
VRLFAGGEVSDKLQVITDMLREMGMEREATWMEQREHVATLLKLNPRTGEYYVCQVCEMDDGMSHLQACPVAAAWRALGDPRGAEDVERAHEESLRQESQRMNRAALGRRGLTLGKQFTFTAPNVTVDPNVKAGDVFVFNPRSIMRITNLETPGTLLAGPPDETK